MAAASTSETETETHNGAVSKSRIAPLIAKRRANMSDDWIESHDTVTKDSRKVREIVRPGPEDTTKILQIDYSAMLATTPSTTSNLDILVMEAKIIDEQPDRWMNPHLPANNEVLDEATERIEAEDLVPAWEVVDQ